MWTGWTGGAANRKRRKWGAFASAASAGRIAWRDPLCLRRGRRLAACAGVLPTGIRGGPHRLYWLLVRRCLR